MTREPETPAERELFELATSVAADFLNEERACDICHQAILKDEPHHETSDEIVHTACVQSWFSSNFGREDLR